MFTIEDFKAIKNGTNTSEERYSRDRFMYQQGRVGSEEVLSQRLSERDMDCYNMGYSAFETLG